MRDRAFRYANIGIAAAFAVLFGGGFLLRNAREDVLQILGPLAFIVAFGVYFFLEERASRRAERDQ